MVQTDILSKQEPRGPQSKENPWEGQELYTVGLQRRLVVGEESEKGISLSVLL